MNKFDEFVEDIKVAASKRGLTFVWGPGNQPSDFPLLQNVGREPVNQQERVTISFSVV